jgi:hypothetical protein
LGFAVLGGLTTLHLWRKYGLEKRALRLKQCLTLNLLLFGTAVVFRYLLDGRLEGMLFGSTVVATEVILFVLYCGALLRMKVRWAVELTARLGLPGGIIGTRHDPATDGLEKSAEMGQANGTGRTTDGRSAAGLLKP